MTLTIISRAANGLAPPISVSRVSLAYWQGVSLHHSGGPPNQSLRQIQQAAFNDGLWDTHYSLFVRNGVHEGRGLQARPAGDNQNVNVQICLPGNWSGSLPPQRDLDQVVELILWLDDHTGRKLSRNVVGHRDVPGNSTACPGDAFHRWIHDDLPGLLAAGGGAGGGGGGAVGLRPAPGPVVAFPLPSGSFFGPPEWDNDSVSGFYGRVFRGQPDHYWLKTFGQQLVKRGWPAGKGRRYLTRYGHDGRYGQEYRELIVAFQRDQGLTVDGLVGPATWHAAYHNPVT